MAFSFGFSGDDIDVDDSEINDVEEIAGNAENAEPLPELVAAKKHKMEEWLPTLPSQISYSRLRVAPSPSDSDRGVTLARREIFDIRTQLMAEDVAEQDSNEELITGLKEGDIKPNFYEGGFKTWECALDLARLVITEDVLGLSEVGDGPEVLHIIELGAGTAIPSLALFAQLLLETQSEPPRMRYHFTFADYNSSVLRLATLPNLLLTWNTIVSSQNRSGDEASDAAHDEELDITPELLENFEKDLSKRGITVDFISGTWSPAFVDLVFSTVGEGKTRTVILASETIYSPSSLRAFSETLLGLLRRSTNTKAKSRALIATKKVYFGVGGGMDEFLAILRQNSRECDVKEKVNVKSEGVVRVILEATEPGSGSDE